jgi:MFS family permease
MGAAARLIDFLGLRRSMVGLLVMVVLVGMGEKMAERFLPIYLLSQGGGTFAIGSLGFLQNLLGALYSYPAGYLAGRLGPKRSLLLFNALTILGYLIVLLIPTWWAVLAGAMLFLCWSAVSLPATMGLVARVLPHEKRTMGVSMHSLVRRIPMALGPLAGGALIVWLDVASGVRLGLAAAILMTLVAMLLQQALMEDDRPAGRESSPVLTVGAPRGPLGLFRQMSPALKNLLFSDILIRFCEQIPNAFVVVWCMRVIAAPVDGFQFGVLSAIEMGTAAMIYIPVAWLADRGAKRPFVLLTFVFFTTFPLILLYCQSFWPLVGAFVVRGLKEFGDATRKALILDLAPPERREETFGLYYLLRDSIVSVAAFAGALLWALSPQINLLTAFTCGTFGTLWYALGGRQRTIGISAPPHP